MARPAPGERVVGPPPVSFTKCWDKGKWHFEAPSFPANLPRSAGWAHILAALQFLDERGQLTAAGKDQLAHADEEIALLDDQIKAGARAFLDQTYEAYRVQRRVTASPRRSACSKSGGRPTRGTMIRPSGRGPTHTRSCCWTTPMTAAPMDCCARSTACPNWVHAWARRWTMSPRPIGR
ncbi:MAG: hypothetical protein NVS2B9_00140 [Myxococcales bacterium]